MKMLAMLLVLASFPAKPWKVEMCVIQQNETVSDDYIRFCIRKSPDKYPRCDVNGRDPREAMWAAQAAESQAKHGAYFEVLDCSWHSGINPRNGRRAGERNR